MSQIVVDAEALDQGIENLRSLASDLEGLSLSEVGESGGGSTKAGMIELEDTLDQVRASLATLVGNSIAFFEAAEQTLVSTDEAAASAIGGGAS